MSTLCFISCSLLLHIAFSNGGSVTDSGVGTITEESNDPKDEYVIGK